jgi:hypothetical protein
VLLIAEAEAPSTQALPRVVPRPAAASQAKNRGRSAPQPWNTRMCFRIPTGRMELHEFHVLEGKSSSADDRHAVSGAGVGGGTGQITAAHTARRHHLNHFLSLPIDTRSHS